MLKENTSTVESHLTSGSKIDDSVSPNLHHQQLVNAIQAKMKEMGVNATQLALKIGFSKSKVSEILNRKRPLSKRMAKALYAIGISSDVLFKALIDVE